MRFIRGILIMALIGAVIYYFFNKYDISTGKAIDQFNTILEQKKEEKVKKQTIPTDQVVTLEGDVFQWVGRTEAELIETLGEPIRKDESAYGYNWSVYTDQQNAYIQFGIENGTIATVYATGKNLSIDPIQIGQTYEMVSNQFAFEKDVVYSAGISNYTFHLNEEDLKMRPLVKLSEELYLQCYFDTFTNKLSSIRVLTADVLLKHRPYEIEYRGNLPAQPDLSKEKWQTVEAGMERQIFDITNVIRHQFGKSNLQWEDQVREVAFLHSKDMEENNYFSHYGLDGSGLKERLSAGDVLYIAAGENIAAQYSDAPAAMEGWLNSEGHREALLKDDYTHLGVGVYHLYYTQNFLKKP